MPRLKRLSVARLAHGEDNLDAAVEIVDHLQNDRHVILQVGIERDHRIGFSDLWEQTGQQCVLMSDIARQFESADALRLRVRDFFDEVQVLSVLPSSTRRT